MPLGLTAQTNIAFKNNLGKSETYVVNDISNEPYGISFNIPSTNIWTNNIPNSATQAVSLGVALAVTASMLALTSSNGYAYTVNWPSDAPTGIDATTGLPYAYNSGVLTNINAGDRIQNAISDYYDISYSISIFGADNNIIASSDNRNWIYQYNSGIYFQENILTPNPSTASIYVYIGSTLDSQPNTPYSSSTYSNFKIGGLSDNSSFVDVSVNEILDFMLYSNNPSIDTFRLIGLTSSYEVGNGVVSGNYTFSWGISNTYSLVNNNVYIYGTNSSIIYGPTNNNGTISGYTLPLISFNTPFTYTWRITALDSSGIKLSKKFDINWCYSVYYGFTTSSLMIDTFENLQSRKLGTSAIGNYTIPGGYIGYKYFIIPDSFTAISSIVWNNMPLVMADNSDGYTFSANNLNYNLVSYQNIYSITSNYKIYRSKYMLTATMSNVIIS